MGTQGATGATVKWEHKVLQGIQGQSGLSTITNTTNLYNVTDGTPATSSPFVSIAPCELGDFVLGGGCD